MRETVAADFREDERTGLLTRVARRGVFASLGQLQNACVRLRDGLEERVFGASSGEFPAEVRIEVRDPEFYRDVLLGGTLAAGEAWIRGLWTCDDLPTLLRMLLRNSGAMSRLDPWLARLTAPLHRLVYKLQRNTRRGSRRNIAAHYDLGNDFFALFLDPTLTYSCGVFERPDASMEQASIAKYERICKKLALGPEHHVLEIGTGWGGFAMHAAGVHGCRVTTTTLSQQQRELALERIAAAGLSGRIEVLLEDYRDLRGSYDRLVSIEMIEAVGHEYFDSYFRVCGERLAPHGMMALQAIVIGDRDYERARRTVDFIKRYIFPGGALPSLRVLGESIARVSDLCFTHLEDLSAHYGETLRRWHAKLEHNRAAIRALGYSEEFLRMWEFYLCSCEASFDERHTRSVQIVLEKPGARHASILGALG